MSDVAASQNALVPREEQAAILAAALAAVRNTEGERRWNIAIGRLSGWFVAAAMVMPLCYCLSIIAKRPLPKDHIWVAIMHSDGSTEEAKPIEDLTASEHDAAVSQFIFEYVENRVAYSWENIQHSYDRTRFVTFGDAQKAYVEEMTISPDRPTESLGKVGERRAESIEVNPTGPHAYEAVYTLKIKTKDGVWLPDMRRRVEIAFGTFNGLPPEIARRLDPLKLVVIGWNDHPAAYNPTAPGGKR